MNLTDAQLAAVTDPSDEVLVIAGAGSGKTRVLVHRIAHLLKHGASLQDLLVLTFTRRAALEMKTRLAELLGGQYDARQLLMGTFHSVALSILRIDGALLGYDVDRLTILEPHDADMLLEQVCVDLGFAARRTDTLRTKLTWKQKLSWAQVARFREHYYTTGKWETFTEQPLNLLHQIMAAYLGRMHEYNVLDFGSILCACGILLTDFPEVKARWQARIKHVLVDELQDIDEVQYSLHGHFAPPATFFGVGDRRQSIYGWRGARPDLMTEQHPNASVVDLVDCFRSTRPIVHAANTLIAHNGDTLAKPMVGHRDGCDVTPATEMFCDCEYRLKFVHQRTARPWGDFAILARKHATLRLIERALAPTGIPTHRVGAGFDVCDTDEFRAVHAAMRLSLNPRDRMAFLRLRQSFGIDAAALARLTTKAAERGETPFSICRPMEGTLWHFVKHGTRSLTHRFARLSDWLHAYVGFLGSAAEESWNSIGEFLRSITDERWYPIDFWNQRCPDMTLTGALRWFALRDSQDDQTDRDAVTLCTVHAAKGLEWPYVIVAGLNEYTFPSSQSLKTPDALLEERRCAYVALTRAKDILELHALPPGMMIDEGWGDKEVGAVSRFVQECRTCVDHAAT